MDMDIILTYAAMAGWLFRQRERVYGARGGRKPDEGWKEALRKIARGNRLPDEEI